jgi:glucosamine--fructose-6-phosphate aminotransferase (isomerizing)
MEQLFQYEDALQEIARDIATNQRRVVVVGAGPNAATAPEGALKAKEAAYITIEGLELEQAIHGPLVSFESHDLIIVVSVEGPAQPRIADFLRALNEINTRVLLLGTLPTRDIAGLFQRAEWQQIALLQHGELLEELSPLLTVVPLQLLADFLATARGTNADSFRKEQEAYKRATEQYTL